MVATGRGFEHKDPVEKQDKSSAAKPGDNLRSHPKEDHDQHKALSKEASNKQVEQHKALVESGILPHIDFGKMQSDAGKAVQSFQHVVKEVGDKANALAQGAGKQVEQAQHVVKEVGDAANALAQGNVHKAEQIAGNVVKETAGDKAAHQVKEMTKAAHHAAGEVQEVGKAVRHTAGELQEVGKAVVTGDMQHAGKTIAHMGEEAAPEAAHFVKHMRDTITSTIENQNSREQIQKALGGESGIASAGFAAYDLATGNAGRLEHTVIQNTIEGLRFTEHVALGFVDQGAAIGKVVYNPENENVKYAWNKMGAFSIPVNVAYSLGDFGGKVGHAALTLGTAGVEHLKERGAGQSAADAFSSMGKGIDSLSHMNASQAGDAVGRLAWLAAPIGAAGALEKGGAVAIGATEAIEGATGTTAVVESAGITAAADTAAGAGTAGTAASAEAAGAGTEVAGASAQAAMRKTLANAFEHAAPEMAKHTVEHTMEKVAEAVTETAELFEKGFLKPLENLHHFHEASEKIAEKPGSEVSEES